MKDYWFGEWVEYRDEEDKIDAKNYLHLWKKFILRKLKNLELIEERWVDRNKSFSTSITTLGLKLYLKGEKLENFDINYDGKYIYPISIGEICK